MVGLAQVRLSRTNYEGKIDYDHVYVDTHSLIGDLRLFFVGIPKCILGKW